MWKEWVRWSWNCFLVFKQKTAYEVRISDWSSDVCSSDLSRFSVGTKTLSKKSSEVSWACRPNLSSLRPLANPSMPSSSTSSEKASVPPEGSVFATTTTRSHWIPLVMKVFEPLTTQPPEIGRAHVCTPVTNAHLVCRLLLEKKQK